MTLTAPQEPASEKLAAPPRLVVGDYVLHEMLGEGGMGQVYRATHRFSGKQVALKRIRGEISQRPKERTQLSVMIGASSCSSNKFQPPTGVPTSSDDSLRKMLAQEFQTLASLHHPNIVNVLDYGFDLDQSPFFTMELLESPKSILVAAASRDLRGKIDLLVQLLHSLAYLHRRKILHCDIKPTNVLVVDNQVKLLDFGIAEAVGTGQRLAGTLHYMAPEFFLGDGPSTASDLYAVGVVASEIFTNQLPEERTNRTDFLRRVLGEDADRTLGPDIAELMESWRTDPEPVNTCLGEPPGGQLPESELGEGAGVLSGIIRKLLARDPSQRYNDALHVIRDLGAAIGQDLATETSATRESFLQAAEFVGREQELTKLSAALTAAQAGNGSIWMVVGESGVGKSRLIRELNVLALVRSARVARSQAFTERGTNYELWCPIVRALCLDTPMEEAELGSLKDIAPDIETLLERRIATPPPLSPQAAQVRLHNAVVTLLRKQQRPVLILFEDLQWAGTESLELLANLGPVVGELPLLIVGNYREAEAIEELRNLPHTNVLRLGRLNDGQIARLCQSMIGSASPALIEYLKRHTEGNVFFLVEMVRALAEMAGQLQQIGKQELPDQLLTGGMEEIVQRRLEQISPLQRPLLELAAVAGRRVDTKLLEPAARGPELSQFLRDCANAAIFEEERGTWQFAHDKIREWLLHHLDPERARSLHRQVAQTITANYPSDATQHAVLAYHWDKAGEPEPASEYYLRAGAGAARLHAVLEARTHYAAALSTLAQLAPSAHNRRRRVDTTLLIVSMSLWTARLQEILGLLDQAMALVVLLQEEGAATEADNLKEAQINFWRGRARFVHGDYNDAIAAYEQARELARKRGAEELYAVCCGHIGQALFLKGRMRGCWQYLEEAMRWMATRESSSDWPRVVGFQGMSLVARGQIGPGLELINRAVAVAKDPTYVATSQTYLCTAWLLLWDWKALREAALKTIEAAEQVSDHRFHCIGLWLAGWAECRLGDMEASARYRAKAHELVRRYRNIVGHEWWMGADIDAALLAGRAEEAIELAKHTVAVARSVDGLFGEAFACRGWARALAALPEPDWAAVKVQLDQCFELLKQCEADLELAHTHVVAAELASQRGAPAEAMEHLKEAMIRYEAAGLAPKHEDCRQRMRALAAPPAEPFPA